MTTLLETELVAQLQRRIARLLIQHDRTAFRGRFRQFYADSRLPQLPVLQAYDRYIRLISLGDELFDDILPRIRRQMSFQATREQLDEESPLRGQIDWTRSLQHSWNEHPNQPPLRFATTLRQRSFSTPENRLVVALLQEYEHQLQTLFNDAGFTDAALNTHEEQLIDQIIDRIRRELATPHFQELNTVVDREMLPDLAEQVEHHTRHNSAYHDLLGWWQHLNQLHIRDFDPDNATFTLKTSDDSGLLYQLWLALELFDFLEQRQVVNHTISTDKIELHFQWRQRPLRLIYDRQPNQHLAWQHAPSERPDYFITREQPLIVHDSDGALVWQEPGVLLDAKCYTTTESSRATGAIKRMLADMQLVDANYGALILPDLSGIQTPIEPKTERYFTTIVPPTKVQLFALRPLTDQVELHRILTTLLEYVDQALPERPAIACYGWCADKDTVRPHHLSMPMPDQPIFCPKPHISPNHIDLVDARTDCLKNPHVCHIMSVGSAKTLIPPFVQRAVTLEEVRQKIHDLREHLNRNYTPDNTSDEAEQARTNLIESIGQLVDSYTEFAKSNTQAIEDKLRFMFAGYWDNPNQPRSLPKSARDMLISGEFVWYEFQKTSVEDWAACAVQYVRAVEHQLQKRLYELCGGSTHLVDKNNNPLGEQGFTFGTVSHAVQYRQTAHNWSVFVQHSVELSGCTEGEFLPVIKKLMGLHHLRNNIAHSKSIDKEMARKVRTITVGDEQQGIFGGLYEFIKMLNTA